MDESKKEDAAEIKEQLLLSLYDNFRKTKLSYDDADFKYQQARRHGSFAAKQLQQERLRLQKKIKELNTEIKRVEYASLVEIYNEYDTFTRRLLKVFTGDFVLQPKHKTQAEVTVFLIMAAAIAVAKFFGEIAVVLFVAAAFLALRLFLWRHKEQKLVLANP
jgi:hypothetical protein